MDAKNSKIRQFLSLFSLKVYVYVDRTSIGPSRMHADRSAVVLLEYFVTQKKKKEYFVTQRGFTVLNFSSSVLIPVQCVAVSAV